MKEKRIIRLSILHEPVHRADDVRFCGLAHGILLIIGQNHHVLSGIPEMPIQVPAHILDIVDAATKLAALSEVVYADQKRLATARTGGVLEVVALRRT